jgi:hypothetical protein
MIRHMDPSEIVITPRAGQLGPEIVQKLSDQLGRCPDLAFAHLPLVLVPGRQERPAPVLFVWLEAGALRSLRSALNLVSEAVSRALPDGEFLDVVVLNSAPELLDQVEAASSLLVERNPEERARALEAASEESASQPAEPRPWWWPFGS